MFLKDDWGGDTWEYQSLAVNLIFVNGYKSGGIEKFSIYKFRNATEKVSFRRSGIPDASIEVSLLK